VKQNYRKFVALALFVLALSGAALAQDFAPKVRAYIPFNFNAGSKMLPAGTYTVAINRGSNNVAIFQRDTGVGTFLLALPTGVNRQGQPVLTFRSDGDGTYVLVKIEGPDLGLNVPTGKKLSHLALAPTTGETRVVLAELVR
jgi:hypothetical protein